MDLVKFAELILDKPLLEYQKKMLLYIQEHPDCKYIVRRGYNRINLRYLLLYYLDYLYKEESNDR